MEAGFIDSTSDGYHFEHDKLQAAFLNLLDQSEEEGFHLLIGEAYLSVSGDDHAAFTAAVHLNCAPAFAIDSHQKRKFG
jgi:hypothetical protein